MAIDFWRAYMIAFLFALTPCLGGLFFVFGATPDACRLVGCSAPTGEALAANLRWVWMLFVPFAVLWFMGKANLLWVWADMESLKANNEAEYHIVHAKEAFLNPTFFWIRAAVYFAVWALLAHSFLYRRQRPPGRSRRHSSISERLQKSVGPSCDHPLRPHDDALAAFNSDHVALAGVVLDDVRRVLLLPGCATAGFAAMIPRHGAPAAASARSKGIAHRRAPPGPGQVALRVRHGVLGLHRRSASTC
jgi:hypothetical protein